MNEKLTYKERRFLIEWLFWIHMAMAFVLGMITILALQEIW